MYGVFWHTTDFLSAYSHPVSSTYVQARNIRCLHHVISFSLHCYVSGRNVDGVDRISDRRTAVETESAVWTRHSPIREHLTTGVDDTGAPLDRLIRPGSAQALERVEYYNQSPKPQALHICMCPFSEFNNFFDILQMLCSRGWVIGSFHRLLLPNSHWGGKKKKKSQLYQHHPPHT